jgi:PQQ-dependent catabolism-associated CXXCW motif protein
MRLRIVLLCAALITAGAPAKAGEDADFGVPAQSMLRHGELHAPTPRAIPGGGTILTAALRERLRGAADERPLLFDVLGGEPHHSLPGAIWLPGAGRGESFEDAVQAQLGRLLQAATKGSFERPLVFFCQGPHCWLSYNAALRALRLGYREVHWYRGGIEAWLAAGEALAPLRYRWRDPAP